MIRLTKVSGHELYVNPEQVVEVGYDDEYKQTLVQTTAEGWYVTESPEEVARKVLEYRLAMVRYQAQNSDAQFVEMMRNDGFCLKAEEDLRKLAGLEESNHD
jgi:uncharacterized protein YlzI (FlbEa/FlbD family)